MYSIASTRQLCHKGSRYVWFQHQETFVRRTIKPGVTPKVVTAEEAITATVSSANSIFIHSVAAAPQKLIKALVSRAKELQHVKVNHLFTHGMGDYSDPKYTNNFWNDSLFVGGNVRKNVQTGNAGFVPIFLSEVPDLLVTGALKVDVALLQVSPPDRHGYVSLGTSIDVSIDAAHHALRIVAQINPQMPRTHGHGVLHVSEIDYLVESDEALPETTDEESEVIDKVAKNVATLIEDGACLQLGIGSLSNSVCKYLSGHRDLSIHSEMVGDGVVDLIQNGVVTNKYKQVFPGVSVVSFAMGKKTLYDLLHDNPSIQMLRTAFTNNPSVVAKIDKMVAVNSAIEIDITGQVCADSIGSKIYSGIGGQLDFIRGASQSKDGKPIIAMTSVTSKGESKISATLKPGAGVVTTRGHVHYVVTEYGIAYLWGKNLQQRAKALIDIAHPLHQEELERNAAELYGWNKNWKLHWQLSQQE